jgi:hypothetical protein
MGQNTSNVRISVLAICVYIHTGAVIVRNDGDRHKEVSELCAGHLLELNCI